MGLSNLEDTVVLALLEVIETKDAWPSDICGVSACNGIKDYRMTGFKPIVNPHSQVFLSRQGVNLGILRAFIERPREINVAILRLGTGAGTFPS